TCQWPCRRLAAERMRSADAEASRRRTEAVAGEERLRADDLRLILQLMAGTLSARSEELDRLRQRLERSNERAADRQAELGVARDDLTLAEAAIARAQSAAQAARQETERLRRHANDRSSGRPWLRFGYAWRGW